VKTFKEFLDDYKSRYNLEEILIKSEFATIIYWGTLEDFYSNSEVMKKVRSTLDGWIVNNSSMWNGGKKLIIETVFSPVERIDTVELYNVLEATGYDSEKTQQLISLIENAGLAEE